MIAVCDEALKAIALTTKGQRMNVPRCNHSNDPSTITLDCLALPGDEYPDVEIVYNEGTMLTDLHASETFRSLMEHLGLNNDPNDAGCNSFMLTLTTRPQSQQGERS
jgi:hypothetical protein